MNVFFASLTILFLASCSSSSEKSSDETKANANQGIQQVTALSAKSRIAAMDRSLIKSACLKRNWVFSIPASTSPKRKLKIIPLSFLENYIFNLPVSHAGKHIIPNDRAQAYHFYEYWEKGDQLYFSIMYSDESCCHTVYGISVNAKTGEITQACLLGLSGSDGGWGEEDKGQWVNDTTLHVVKAEYYEDNSAQKNKTDTTWLAISCNQLGYFRQVKLDSVHYEEPIH